MQPILFVIDDAFQKVMTKYYDTIPARLNDCHLTAASDLFGSSTTSDNWDNFIDQVVKEVRNESTSLLIVIGHSAIFHGYVPPVEMERPEYRVPAAEEQLRKKLGDAVPFVHVSGFHHDAHSEINTFLFTPEILRQPGTFTRLRRIVEDGGGPLGHLSVLKHELMRPFTSVRLLLQLQADEEDGGFDDAVIVRITTAIEKGRTRLEKLAESAVDALPPYTDAVRDARRLMETDVSEITANPSSFNGWIDRLCDALDDVRQRAR